KAVAAGQLLLGKAVGKVDLKRAGRCQGGKVPGDPTAGGYEVDAVGEQEGRDEVAVIAAAGDSMTMDDNALTIKTDRLLVADKGRFSPVAGEGLAGLVEDGEGGLPVV